VSDAIEEKIKKTGRGGLTIPPRLFGESNLSTEEMHGQRNDYQRLSE
jgi:hypothetical protein